MTVSVCKLAHVDRGSDKVTCFKRMGETVMCSNPYNTFCPWYIPSREVQE